MENSKNNRESELKIEQTTFVQFKKFIHLYQESNRK